MIIKDEIRRIWQRALESYTYAEKLGKEGKYQEVINELDFAVVHACTAVIKLSEELKNPEIKDAVLVILTEWAERATAISKGKQHPTTKETIERAFNSLKCLYDAAPLGILQPLK